MNKMIENKYKFIKTINEFINLNYFKIFNLYNILDYIEKKNEIKDRGNINDVRNYLEELCKKDKLAISHTKYICIEKVEMDE